MIRDTANQDVLVDGARGRRASWRWMFLAALALGAVGLGLAGVRRWGLSERSVDRDRIRIAEVVRGKLVRDIVAEGRVTAANNPTLYAPAAGTVTFRVRAGDATKRGEPLATIASPELVSQLTQQQAVQAGLEAEVGRAGLVLSQGRANAQKLIDQALVDRQTASREVERYRLGYAERVVPELELLRAQDSLAKAEISLAHAQGDRLLSERALGFELRTVQLRLERQREVVRDLARQVDALVICSPVDGQVGQLLVAQSANVAANSPVLRVVDLTAFELAIEVPDSLARDLGVGMSAVIGTGSLEQPGRVRSVAPEVVGGEVESRVEFIGAVPDGLRQNQRLSARILIDEKADVLSVERGPSLDAGGDRSAYFVRDGVAERRSIRTGVASVTAVEILSGAAPGDRLVVSGADFFGDAERVRIADN